MEEYFSVIENNEILSFATIQMDLEGVKEVSQPEKDKYSVITYMWTLKK